jgi:leukotriene-A4 hydrolase
MKYIVPILVLAIASAGFLLMTNEGQTGFLKKNFQSEPYAQRIDNSTNANIEDVVTEHIHLDTQLDFEEKVMVGDVTLSMKILNSSFTEVVLDSRFLNISNASYNGKSLSFEFKEPNPNIGPALHIALDSSMVSGDRFNLTISYATTNETLSLNWLEPRQTMGKSLPYVYTHCEAIDCRSLLPVQDSPAVKSTYSAKIRSPKNISVYMSGNVTDSYDEGDFKYTHIFMDVPIPSYLIALVGGNLVYQKVGDRTGFITEPEFAWKVALDLGQLEQFLIEAEKFLPKYSWGYYNVVVLPPSFPTGGMENPLLTFVSPTIITGDQRLINVAIHELAHSWSGNLITNQNWENFWLNEGITVYTERHISRKINGEVMYKLQSTFGNQALLNAIEEFGENSTFTSLMPNYEGHNPYDTFSEVPYEKGFQFMTFLESLVGQENMEKFLYKYYSKYAYQSIIYTQFWDTFNEFLSEEYTQKQKDSILGQIDFDAWMFNPGMPPVVPDFHTPEIDEAKQLALEYIKLDGKDSPKDYEKFNKYFSSLQCIFVQELINNMDSVSPSVLSKIDEDYSLTTINDPEVKTLWFQVSILRGYKKVYAFSTDFMVNIGRMKFLLPLYKAWNEVDHKSALEIYRAGSLIYHAMAKSRIIKILE